MDTMHDLNITVVRGQMGFTYNFTGVPTDAALNLVNTWMNNGPYIIVHARNCSTYVKCADITHISVEPPLAEVTTDATQADQQRT